MKRGLRIAGGVVAALAGIAATCGALYAMILWASNGPGSAFDRIEVGDSRERVVEVLGAPAEETAEFRLAQREGHEQAYAEARASGAETWLLYHGPIDVTYAVGLDADGRVVYKAGGGT